MVAPAAEKFDGTSMAGSVGALGSGDDAELLGAKVKLDLPSTLEKMRKPSADYDDGEVDEESGNVDDQYDPELVAEHAADISKSLYRAVDAHHVQLLNKNAHAADISKSLYRAVDAHHVQLLNKNASMSILVANYFETSLSEATGLCEGQIVETRHGRAPRSWAEARVERVNDDG